MALIHPKRIQHLARYFGVLGTVCLLGYGIGPAIFFLFFVAPPFILASWVRIHGGPFINWLPNHPFFNNLFLVYPLTLGYFGLIGFELKNIVNERGKLRYLILAVFLVFILYIHRLALHEILLYWDGSQRA